MNEKQTEQLIVYLRTISISLSSIEKILSDSKTKNGSIGVEISK